MRNIYWRWKSDKPWHEARMKDLGDGLVIIYPNPYKGLGDIIASKNEVDIKSREVKLERY